MSLRIFLIVILSLAALRCAPVGAQSPSDAELTAQIARLADPDPTVREQATRALWAAGSAAEPLLRQATDDQNPEIARRSRTILHNISYGLLPDTPAEVTDLLGQYQAGDESQRAMVIARLSNLGPRGIRVLLAIRRIEKDETRRQTILAALTPHAHEGAVALIGDGDLPRALALLQSAAPISEAAARDYAAFLMARGGLAARLAEVKATLSPTTDRGMLRELVYLARAAGDLKTARSAAEQTADPALLDQVLIEQEDWKTLARRYQSRIGDSASIESLGFSMAFERLSGDADGAVLAAIAIKAHAAIHPDDYPKCAEILFLEDRPEDGIDILIRHKDYLRAYDYLLPRMEYHRALDLLPVAEAGHYAQLSRLRARSAIALRFAGKLPEARAALDALQTGRRPDIATWCEIIDARREIDGAAEAQKVLVGALAWARGEAAAELLSRAGFPETFPATFWWEALRRQHPDDPPAQLFDTLKSMAAGQIASGELRKLAGSARLEATHLSVPSVQRDDAVNNIGQTLLAAGQIDDAEQCFGALAESSSNPEPLIHIGDCQAARKDWAAAAQSYHAAWERDRARPDPLALEAAALLRIGPSQRSGDLLDLAHLLALSNDVACVDLAESMSRSGLAEAARREQEIALATSPFVSWGLSHIVRLRGDEALARGDFAIAAQFWERAFLQNMKYNVSFNDSWANAAVPALIHKTRSQGLMAAGDWVGAMTEAQRCRADSPGDADAMIQLVNEFQAHNRSKDADDLFSSAITSYARLAGEYSGSGPLENLQAWLGAKCRRNLDGALTHALRATEFEPANTASLDTLAEVYFQRGQIAEAIKAMNRCIELEPNVEHHRKQLERFKAGQKRA